MKEQILNLRAEGKTYSQIKDILGCSKSTISFHCGVGQKEKSSDRKMKNRLLKPFENKLLVFKSRALKSKVRDFQRGRIGGGFTNVRINDFEENDVIEKLYENPKCYLTGRFIDPLETSSYHFDHITPISKGGTGELSNLGLTCKEANKAKGSLSVSEFIDLCKDVLINNGYQVS
jgi:hypothetical protein